VTGEGVGGVREWRLGGFGFEWAERGVGIVWHVCGAVELSHVLARCTP